jgi:hypothetical protein
MILCRLFDEDYFFDYPEILSLMFVRLALEGSRPRSEIRLELRDIIEDEDEARELHSTLNSSLVQKVNLYNRVFRSLFANEDDIRTRYVRSQVAELIQQCRSETDANIKGRLLERLVELLFTRNNALQVANRRLSTEDEEIDLVVKNNIDRPFWMSFHSPLFFVECKNWSSKVEAKHLRDFEMKLVNHQKLAKVGFFVSFNGFTGGVREELKRAGRDKYHVVLLTAEDIEEFVRSNSDFYVWLEGLTTKFY